MAISAIVITTSLAWAGVNAVVPGDAGLAAPGPVTPVMAGADPWLPIEALDPYLKYPPLELRNSGSSEPYGPQVGVLAVSLDPVHRGRQFFVSSFEPRSGFFGYEGATGTPLLGFSPVDIPGSYAGPALPTAFAKRTSERPDIIPSYDVLLMQKVFDETDVMSMRLIAGDGSMLWSNWPSDPSMNFFASPATVFGAMIPDKVDTIFLVDDEGFDAHGRSASNGTIVWSQFNNSHQQITSPALIDTNGPDAAPAFVFCRGKSFCLLEKHAVKDGTTIWTTFLGDNHIYPFVATGDVDGVPGDEIVAVGRQGTSPFHALIQVVDGSTGSLMWTFDLGEAASWGPAPVLADLDGDGKAEILVQTNQLLHTVTYGEGEAPGWPVATSTLPTLPVRAEAVVGDLDDDGIPEIAIVSNDFNVGPLGHLDVFDATGTRKFFSRTVMMPVYNGLTPAIADLDDDGRNELVLASNRTPGAEAGPLPAVWVLEFSNLSSKPAHGTILWGQFGANPAHSSQAARNQAVATIAPESITNATLPHSSIPERFAIANSGAIPLDWNALAVESDAPCDGSHAVDWVRPDESDGRIAGGHEHVIDLTLDAAQLQPGPHLADLCITTSDPELPEIRVRVSLDVTSIVHSINYRHTPGGIIVPTYVKQLVADGAVLRMAAEPEAGGRVLAFSGCGGRLVGNELIAGPIRTDCEVDARFSGELLFADGFERPLR